jgi:hypothetical protein
VNLNASSGQILSPGYPKNYTGEVDYQWNIAVLPYYSVVLNIIDLRVACASENELRVSINALI